MTTILCRKLESEKSQMAFQPVPGKLGEFLYQNISGEAWQMWLIQQTKIINEYRLNPMDPKAQAFLKDEMLTYLFGSEQIDIE